MPMPAPLFFCQLERLRWRDALRYAWLTLLACTFLKLVLPPALRPLLTVAPLFPLAAKDLSHLPDALARTRAAWVKRAWRDMPAAWLPPELVGLLRLGRDQRRGCIDWLLRRRRAAEPSGQAFGYLERGSYRTACVIAIFAVLVELPLDALLVAVLPLDPGKRQVVHVAMLAGGLATLAWVLGDRRLVGAGRHVLDADALQLRVGARTEGIVPRAAIAGCLCIKESATDWCRAHGIDVRDSVRASPLDRPNVVLVLHAGHGVRLRHFGMERSGMACIFLYVDQPDHLAAALQARPSMQNG